MNFVYNTELGNSRAFRWQISLALSSKVTDFALKLSGKLRGRLFAVALCYALVLIVGFVLVHGLYQHELDQTLLTAEEVYAQAQSGLKEDEYAALDAPGKEIVIYDAAGQRLYSSSRAATESLTFAYLNTLSTETAIEQADFMGFENCQIERIDYKNTKGKARLMAVVSPLPPGTLTAETAAALSRIWQWLIPLFVLSTIFAGTIIYRMVRKARISNDGRQQAAPSEVPGTGDENWA